MGAGDEQKAYRRRQERRFPQHACELPEHPDRVYPVLAPNASRWERVRRRLQKQVVGWSWSRPLRAIRPSTYTLEAEQARQTRYVYWWILHPFCRFVTIWQLVVIANVSLTTFLVPFTYGFAKPHSFIGDWREGIPPTHPFMDVKNPKTQEYISFSEKVSRNVNNVFRCNELVFMVHILLTFITGYYKSSNKEVVLAPSRIIKRYLTSWFFFDLVSTIHFSAEYKNMVVHDYLRAKDISNSEKDYLPKLWIFPYCFKIIRLHYVFTYTSTWCKILNLRRICRRAILFVILFA